MTREQSPKYRGSVLFEQSPRKGKNIIDNIDKEVEKYFKKVFLDSFQLKKSQVMTSEDRVQELADRYDREDRFARISRERKDPRVQGYLNSKVLHLGAGSNSRNKLREMNYVRSAFEDPQEGRMEDRHGRYGDQYPDEIHIKLLRAEDGNYRCLQNVEMGRGNLELELEGRESDEEGEESAEEEESRRPRAGRGARGGRGERGNSQEYSKKDREFDRSYAYTRSSKCSGYPGSPQKSSAEHGSNDELTQVEMLEVIDALERENMNLKKKMLREGKPGANSRGSDFRDERLTEEMSQFLIVNETLLEDLKQVVADKKRKIDQLMKIIQNANPTLGKKLSANDAEDQGILERIEEGIEHGNRLLEGLSQAPEAAERRGTKGLFQTKGEDNFRQQIINLVSKWQGKDNGQGSVEEIIGFLDSSLKDKYNLEIRHKAQAEKESVLLTENTRLNKTLSGLSGTMREKEELITDLQYRLEEAQRAEQTAIKGPPIILQTITQEKRPEFIPKQQTDPKSVQNPEKFLPNASGFASVDSSVTDCDRLLQMIHSRVLKEDFSELAPNEFKSGAIFEKLNLLFRVLEMWRSRSEVTRDILRDKFTKESLVLAELKRMAGILLSLVTELDNLKLKTKLESDLEQINRVMDIKYKVKRKSLELVLGEAASMMKENERIQEVAFAKVVDEEIRSGKATKPANITEIRREAQEGVLKRKREERRELQQAGDDDERPWQMSVSKMARQRPGNPETGKGGLRELAPILETQARCLESLL